MTIDFRARLLARAELEDVEHALRRFAAGIYDHCERCGRPIGEARHTALPEATRCADCARQR